METCNRCGIGINRDGYCSWCQWGPDNPEYVAEQNRWNAQDREEMQAQDYRNHLESGDIDAEPTAGSASSEAA